ncbi:MAG: MATE family efflux transporter [Rhodospirillales bacterium]|nr:MATE family efflux transporter [Rhodospirillales bacterium]
MKRVISIFAKGLPWPDVAEPWRAEGRATAALAWPLVMAFLSETGIAIIDVIFIGRLGAGSLAAASLGTAAFFGMLLLGLGVVLATAPLAAQAMGARNPRQVRRVIRQGLWIAILLSVPASLLLMRAEPVLVLLDQPLEASHEAQIYLNYLAWALPSAICFMVLRNFAAVLNRPKLGLWVILAAIPLNAVLDYGLIFGAFGLPRMEIAGAGLASLIAHVFMFGAMLWIVLSVRPLSRYQILTRFWRPDWAVFGQIFKVGLPISGILVMEFSMFVGALIMIGWIGTNALAAHQIALMLASFTFKVPLGISQAATVRVGHAAGRGDVPGVARAGWTAMAVGVAFMVAASIVMWIWPEALVSIFLDADDPANTPVVALAASLILVAAVFQVCDGAQTIGAGVLRGLSDTVVPMTFAAFGYWALGLSAGYLLGFKAELGAIGVWIGMAVGLIAVAVFHAARFRYLVRKGHLPGVAPK